VSDNIAAKNSSPMAYKANLQATNVRRVAVESALELSHAKLPAGRCI